MSVYIIRCGAYVKIGYSRDPKARVAAIRSDRAIIRPADFDWTQPIELLKVLPAHGFGYEAALHHRFAEYRACGEWFHATPDLLRQVAALPGPPEPEPLRLLSIPVAAQRLGYSTTTVYGLIAKGHLRPVDIRASGKKPKTRVRSDDLDAFIEARTRDRPA